MKQEMHTGLAPAKIAFADQKRRPRDLADLAMGVMEMGQVRGICTHPAGFTGLNAAGYTIT